jgi:nitrite reductase/ring-hydroxylating ferredoxin subunit
MISGRIVCAGFKWRTDLRTGKLQARIAIKEEIAKTGKAQRKLRTLMTSCLYI